MLSFGRITCPMKNESAALTGPAWSGLSPQQTEHVFASLLALVFVLDRSGHFLFINKGSLSILGYAPEELMGRSCFDIIAAEDRTRTEEYLEQQAAGRQILHFVNHFIGKNGNKIPVSWGGRWDKKDQLLYTV